jgi:SAM-dependent methyltransferase
VPLEMDWTKTLQCPRCCARELTIQPKPGDDDPLPARGEAMCAQCGARYPIADHVLDLTRRGDGSRRTIAGWSNELPLAPQIYENVWRPRSLSVLTGQSFPVWREIALVTEWLTAKPEELVVDLGSSTDLYARGIARSAKDGGAPAIVAIDLAAGMLRAGRSYARREGITNIAHVRAPADRLPFADGAVDALVCGGSLNEFRSMDAALREARRVCARNGRMVAMSLLAANSRLGKFAQAGVRASGIKFPSRDAFNAAVDAAGWRRERQQVFGAVAFTLMRPAERRAQ